MRTSSTCTVLHARPQRREEFKRRPRRKASFNSLAVMALHRGFELTRVCGSCAKIRIVQRYFAAMMIKKNAQQTLNPGTSAHMAIFKDILLS